MAKYRDALPQLRGNFFMTDGGIETTLIFLEAQQLPHFAAFHLLKTPSGDDALRKYFHSYGALAKQFNVGLILETATWRASQDWAKKLGYSGDDLEKTLIKSVSLLEEIRSEYESDYAPTVISGCLGPRGDGYIPDSAMSVSEAQEYHLPQIRVFSETAADMVTAITMNYTQEAIGIAWAAQRVKMPVVISFTVETNGNLPTGQTLGEAITQVDEATSGYPAYFMINCAHPTHFKGVLQGDEPWLRRIRGLRANASRMSHTELNEASELDIGDPAELGQLYATLKCSHLPELNVMGGCCGTDVRHVEQIALACLPFFRPAT